MGYSSVLRETPRYAQLVEEITHKDPQRRPTAVGALAEFRKLLHAKNLTE